MKNILNIKHLLLGAVLLGSTQLHAQQDPQYTQYMYNTVNINPAYAGSRGAMSIFGLHRTQWVGLDRAPVTNTLSVNTPIKNSKLGLGVSLINDRLGIMDENTLSVDVSYTLDFGGRENHKLSFGIKGSANLLSLDYELLKRFHPDDANLTGQINNEFTPNFGAGVYYHSDHAYLGLSVPNFLTTDRYNDNDRNTSYSMMRQKMHFHVIGGYVFDVNPSLKFKPAFLIKAVEGAPIQVDLTGNFMLYDKFTLGGAYRLDAAWSALVGFQITDELFMGYTYDSDIKALKNYNHGSHEIFVRFDLFHRNKRMNSPRFF